MLCQLSNAMWKPSGSLAPGGDLGDELLRRLAGLLGRDHDRRAVRVVGADKCTSCALHALEAAQMSAWMYSMMWPMWKVRWRTAGRW